VLAFGAHRTRAASGAARRQIAESGASIEQSLFSAELASDRQSPEYLQLCAAAGAVG